MARTTANHRRAWGQIRRLPAGNYQASYLGPDRCRYTAETTYTTRPRAEGWLADERRLIENHDWKPPAARAAAQAAAALTLADYAEAKTRHGTLGEFGVLRPVRLGLRTLFSAGWQGET